MSHYNPGPGWIPPGPPPQPRRGLVNRPAFWITIVATAFLAGSCGIGIGAAGDSSTDTTPAADEAQPTATVTATVTPAANKAAPQPTVTVTKTVKVEVTESVTEETAAEDTSSGGGNVYYENCAAARAAGAAPVYRGEPGYGSHLDRDNDGVGCDWG